MAGCGGGGGGSAPPPPPPPVLTVQASADEYTINADAAARLAVQDNDKIENTAGATAVLSVIDAPKNGSAEADGAVLSYRPRAGYFGEDSLRYRLSVGGVTSEATVKLKVEGSLQLKGVTRPQALAGAQVEVRVGSRQYTTTADAQGEFLVNVRAFPQDMVILKATGQGSQSAGVYTSVAGEIGRVEGAVSGATLTPAQWPNLRLTPSSTVWAALLARQGKTPASQAELMAMSQAIHIDDFIDAGWPVYRFVDLGRLIYRENTWRSIPEYFGAAQFPQFLDEKRADTGITLAFGLSVPIEAEGEAPAVPTDRAARLVYAQGVAGAPSPALVFTLQPGGRASFTSTGKSQGATWAKEGSAIRVVFDEALHVSGNALGCLDPTLNRDTQFGSKRVAYYYADDCRGEEAIESYLLSDIGSSDGAATAAVLKKFGHVVQNNGAQVPIEISPSRPWKRYTTLPFTSADFEAGTRWAGPFGQHQAPPLSSEPNNFRCCSSKQRADIARFSAANGVEMEISGAKGSWRLVDGAIELALPDSSYRYRRLTQGQDGEEHWLMEQWVAGELLAAYEIPATRAEQVTLDATQLARTWQSNYEAQFRQNKFYMLIAGGQGVRLSAPYSETQAPVLRFDGRSSSMYWELQTNGQVRMATGEFYPSPGFALCNPFVPPAPASGCATTNPNQWRVVAKRGQTLFVLESTDPSSGAQALIALRDKGPAQQ